MCFILTVKLIHCLLWLLFFSSLNVPLHFLSCRKNASSSYAISKKWYDFCDDSFVMIIHAFFKVFSFFLQETVNWKVLHPNSSEFSMVVERKSVPNMLFGISVETSPLFSNSRNWTSSGIKWNTCIYKKNGSEFIFFSQMKRTFFSNL